MNRFDRYLKIKEINQLILMGFHRSLVVGFIIISTSYPSSCSAFTQSLDLIVTNNNNTLLANFQFNHSLNLTRSDGDIVAYGSFSPTIVNVISDLCHRDECTIQGSITRGRWRYADWGFFPITPGEKVLLKARSQGSELAVSQFTDSTQDTHPSELNAINFARTAKILSHLMATNFDPNPLHNDSAMKRSTSEYETLCTENLYPVIQLLPCEVESGISTLLRSPRLLFNTPFQSLSLTINSTDRHILKYQINFTVVFDLIKYHLEVPKYSLESIFGNLLGKKCIFSHHSPTIRISPPSSAEKLLYGQDPKLYNLEHLDPPKECKLNAQRKVYLQSRVSGLISFQWINYSERILHIEHRDVIPVHFLNLFLGESIINGTDSEVKLHTIESGDHRKFIIIDISFSLLPGAATYMSVPFRINFKSIHNHASKGGKNLMLPGSQIFFTSGPKDRKSKHQWDYMNLPNSVVIQPVFDGSMAYTVITLALTCIGFLYGIIFNITHRRFHKGQSPAKERLVKLLARLTTIKDRIISRFYSIPLEKAKDE